MKYNICGFDQRKLCSFIEENKEMGKSLDCTDLVILNWIADFSVRASVKKVIMDGIQYAWIAYKKIVEDLPFIPISKRAFAERFDKLHAFGLIEKRIEKESGIGTFMYIRVLPKFEELLYDNNNNLSKYRFNYQSYLCTKHWKQVRALKLKQGNYKCQICGDTSQLEVHHNSYSHLGYEQKHLEDLVVLCHNCHSMFHNKIED